MSELRDEFTSEGLDLESLSLPELEACWRRWLALAQSSNDVDRAGYSHGVFDSDAAPAD